MTSTSKNNNQLHNNIVMNISCNNNNNNNNNTTFVQADPSNFRSVVQKLTGFESNKLPIIDRARSSTFKLHERRHSTRNLECIFTVHHIKWDGGSSSFLASPVSPLEMLTRGISPRSTMEEDEEEEEKRAITEKRFYLHPNTPRASQPPQLLSLFPLQSPKATHHS
uniref:VQ domain-containing protein n=1 Tax=Solanum tuberosum TaxID=4113 RepID=M1CSK2_SOLTU